MSAALELFGQRIPRLRDFRNPTTHYANTDALDDVVITSAALTAEPDGSLAQMVNPRSVDQDAAIELLDVVDAQLRKMLRESIAAAPAEPLDVQIKKRSQNQG